MKNELNKRLGTVATFGVVLYVLSARFGYPISTTYILITFFVGSFLIIFLGNKHLSGPVKEFITVFIKAILFIAFIVLAIYLFFVLSDLLKSKFGIDLRGPAGIIGYLFVIVVFCIAWYHRIMSLIQ